MNILSIDTSTQKMSISLGDGAEVFVEVNISSSQSHSERIISAIDKVLEKAGLNIRNIDCIACIVGPGSYTGLRIGIATAMGLSAPFNIPMMGISTLVAMSWELHDKNVLVSPVMDAKMGQIFTALLQYKNGDSIFIRPEQAVVPQDFVVSLEGEIYFVCEDVEKFRSVISQNGKIRPNFYTPRNSIASAAILIAGERIKRYGLKGEKLEPNYLRKSSAELRLGI